MHDDDDDDTTITQTRTRTHTHTHIPPIPIVRLYTCPSASVPIICRGLAASLPTQHAQLAAMCAYLKRFCAEAIHYDKEPDGTPYLTARIPDSEMYRNRVWQAGGRKGVYVHFQSAAHPFSEGRYVQQCQKWQQKHRNKGEGEGEGENGQQS